MGDVQRAYRGIGEKSEVQEKWLKKCSTRYLYAVADQKKGGTESRGSGGGGGGGGGGVCFDCLRKKGGWGRTSKEKVD